MPNFSAVSHAITPRSLMWVGRALFITLGIVGFSNLIFYSSSSLDVSSSMSFDSDALELNYVNSDLSVNILNIPDTAAEVALSLTWPKQSTALSYGSQAELFRFALEAESPYTLRYLTFHMKARGLDLGEEWKLYEITDGKVDFSQWVGESESVLDLGKEGQTVRLRLFSSRATGFLGKEGEMEFAVMGRVLKDPTAQGGTLADSEEVDFVANETALSTGEPVLLEIWFPVELPSELNWAWLPGEHTEAWINVLESLGIEALAQVPERGINKH